MEESNDPATILQQEEEKGEELDMTSERM